MTYREIKRALTSALNDVRFADNPSFEAQIIVCHFSSLSPAALLMRAEEEASEKAEKEIFGALEQRRRGRPLQYILGKWEFCSRDFLCGEGCLIPRPETELLAQKVAELAPHGARILDLCTGSGCIAISALLAREDISGVALDISPDALCYARKNAELHGVTSRLEIVEADLARYAPGEKFDVIVSNPPYVKSADVDAFDEEMKKEPRLAFDGGEDGLTLYRIIAKKYKNHLADNGLLLLEAGFDTVTPLARLLEGEGFEVKILPDAFGVDRFCIAKAKD